VKSYQVLARKWRPRFFDEMVGQEHVLRALINALNNQKLHHAYLFTGTRGVGKTTIARILAKCLNCEEGISARPCGKCSACQEIAQGRFVDLIEVDAASRTKVDDTRELLDNVQYAPTRGRFKVYLIDEVHMLSTHSFNALLKTLEEPPEHVKFLLATTDPQKLPVTVLSRCLQFNLKNMPAQQIVQHLQHVLSEEQVAFDEPALWQIGRAAQGSMRDALSLTDQAIAYGEGHLSEDQVNAMLGTMDKGRLFQLAEHLANADAQAALNLVATLSEHGSDYDEVLQALLSVWHRTALAQLVPNAVDNSEGDKDVILALAQAMRPEDLQLYYQIGVSGRKDLALAPDSRQGFEMLLLRMLAFCPAPAAPITLQWDGTLQKKKSDAQFIAVTRAEENLAPLPVVETGSDALPETKLEPEPVISAPAALVEVVHTIKTAQRENAHAAIEAEPTTLTSNNWWQWVARLPLAGLALSIAKNSALVDVQGADYFFDVDPSQSFVYNEGYKDKIEDALRSYFAAANLHMVVQEPRMETPTQRQNRLQFTALHEAQQALEGDALVQRLQRDFNAQIISGSIAPHGD
jgi:DNA polymerase-3 subunit gamma/tau